MSSRGVQQARGVGKHLRTAGIDLILASSAMVAARVGALTAPKVDASRLRRIFAGFLIAVSVLLVLKPLLAGGQPTAGHAFELNLVGSLCLALTGAAAGFGDHIVHHQPDLAAHQFAQLPIPRRTGKAAFHRAPVGGDEGLFHQFVQRQEPGAQAIARTAAPAYGGSAAPAGGLVGLPAQAFTGPSAQTYVAPR